MNVTRRGGRQQGNLHPVGIRIVRRGITAHRNGLDVFIQELVTAERGDVDVIDDGITVSVRSRRNDGFGNLDIHLERDRSRDVIGYRGFLLAAGNDCGKSKKRNNGI